MKYIIFYSKCFYNFQLKKDIEPPLKIGEAVLPLHYGITYLFCVSPADKLF